MSEDFATIQDLQHTVDELRAERDRYKNMAEEFGSHLNRALYDDVWDTREYAIVSCNKWEDEFYGGRRLKLPSSVEAVETVVRMLSLGNADPLKVYPPGRYQGD
jgi:hypothetical protein